MLRPELAASAPTGLEHTLPLLEESPPYLRKPQDWRVAIIASITEQNRMTLALDVVNYAEGRRIAADTTVNPDEVAAGYMSKAFTNADGSANPDMPEGSP